MARTTPRKGLRKGASAKSALPSRAETPISTPAETHQQAADGQQPTDYLTTNHGTPISDNQNSLRLGPRGPTLLEDFILREKIFHFDHERIPERIVHARGSGAHGFFECTRAIPELTRATVFAKKGKRTPVFCRFSTVAGSKGSKDTARDVRGFAVKFYSDEGNWDLVGNNIPVFFIQDAIKFPDLVHSVKPEADRMFPQAASAHDTFWDFVSLMPETMHMIMWVMSDRAIPRSFRMMEGFGVHTFRFVNAAGESRFVKFHWRPRLGMQSTLWDEAVKISGADPDYHRRDLWEAITSGNPPEWDLGVQVFDEAFAAAQPYDVLDATKIIPEEDLPLMIVGRLVLDRWPDNFFAEDRAGCIPPVEHHPRHRFLGRPVAARTPLLVPRYAEIAAGHGQFPPDSRQRTEVSVPELQRDGMMQTQVFKGRATYEPNSLGEAANTGSARDAAGGFRERGAVALEARPAPKLRIRAESFADHYSQARLFYRSQTPIEQAHLASRSCSSCRRSSSSTCARASSRACATSTTARQPRCDGLANAASPALPPPSSRST
jgi:catalase